MALMGTEGLRSAISREKKAGKVFLFYELFNYFRF